MTTALDSFNEYMAAPCHELDERDAGRNDPHSQCFDEWGVPREMLFWLWEAAMRAAAQPSRAEVLRNLVGFMASIELPDELRNSAELANAYAEIKEEN